jgi:hypothetical protein
MPGCMIPLPWLLAATGIQQQKIKPALLQLAQSGAAIRHQDSIQAIRT